MYTNLFRRKKPPPELKRITTLFVLKIICLMTQNKRFKLLEFKVIYLQEYLGCNFILDFRLKKC